MSFKAEGFNKASSHAHFQCGELYLGKELVAQMQNVSVARKLKEIRSGFRGVVTAYVPSASVEWKANNLQFVSDPGLSQEYILICHAPNAGTSWHSARFPKCRVSKISTGEIIGEAFPDAAGNVAEFIAIPNAVPAPIQSVPEQVVTTLSDALNDLGKSFAGASGPIAALGKAIEAASPPEKKKEEKKPFVPGVILFTKRAVDFDED